MDTMELMQFIVKWLGEDALFRMKHIASIRATEIQILAGPFRTERRVADCIANDGIFRVSIEKMCSEILLAKERKRLASERLLKHLSRCNGSECAV